jgi:tetratricopeptide (TPR) repeat protein
MELGRIERAHGALNRLLYLQPQHTDAKFMKAHLFRLQKDFDNALREYNTIISINPKIAKVYYAIGEMFMLVKKQDEMVAVFKLARKRIPDFHPKQFQNMNAQQIAFWDKILSQ